MSRKATAVMPQKTAMPARSSTVKNTMAPAASPRKAPSREVATFSPVWLFRAL